METLIILMLFDSLAICLIGLIWVAVYHWSGRAGVVGAIIGVFAYHAVLYWSML